MLRVCTKESEARRSAPANENEGNLFKRSGLQESCAWMLSAMHILAVHGHWQGSAPWVVSGKMFCDRVKGGPAQACSPQQNTVAHPDINGVCLLQW